MATPASTKMEIDVSPSPEAQQAIALRAEARSLVVSDQHSHAAALERIKMAKLLKRAIENHWARIKRVIDNTKRDLLNLEREDLEPVNYFLETATRVSLTYENEERRRAQEEQDRVRRAAEEQARVDREREQARMEQQALKAEAGSKDLSEREQNFVAFYCIRGDALAAAASAGYKDPSGQASRLIATPKIVRAIAAKREAIAIRDQAAAKRDQPLEVVVPKVEAQLGKAAGVSSRKTYGADVIDLEAFKAAVLAGTISTDYILPNGPELNRVAGKGPDVFEQAFPGCKLRINQTIAG